MKTWFCGSFTFLAPELSGSKNVIHYWRLDFVAALPSWLEPLQSFPVGIFLLRLASSPSSWIHNIIFHQCPPDIIFSCSPSSRAPSPSSWSPAAGCWSPAASRPLAPVFSITKKKSRRSYLHLLLLDPGLHLARLKPIGHLCLSLGRVHLQICFLQYSQYPPRILSDGTNKLLLFRALTSMS